MSDPIPLPDDVSELARRLGQRGGRRTKRRGSAYYARIGRLGAQQRWHHGHDDAVNGERSDDAAEPTLPPTPHGERSH